MMTSIPNSPITQTPNSLKVAFFGSSKYSVIVKKALTDKFGLALVVTAPDKPSGRKRKLTPTRVKELALKNKIDVITPAKLDKTAIENITKAQPDFLVVCDYGLILPKELLKVPKYGALNIHHSLLPKYRGPTPVPSAILAGEKKSGVTIISMAEDVDAGDILAQKEYILKEDETCDSLLTALNTQGAQLVIDVIESYLSGSVKKIKQDSSKATLTHRLTKQDGFIDLDNPPDPEKLDRMIRAYHTWPGVWSKVPSKDRSTSGGKVKSEKSVIIKFLPPTILPSHKPTDPFLIQPEGKRAMSIKEFKNGYPAIYEQIKHLFSQKVWKKLT